MTSNAGESRAAYCRGQGPRKTVAFYHRNIGRSQLDPYRHGLPAQIFVRGLACPYRPGIGRAYRDRPLCRARILFGSSQQKAVRQLLLRRCHASGSLMYILASTNVFPVEMSLLRFGVCWKRRLLFLKYHSFFFTFRVTTSKLMWSQKTHNFFDGETLLRVLNKTKNIIETYMLEFLSSPIISGIKGLSEFIYKNQYV